MPDLSGTPPGIEMRGVSFAYRRRTAPVVHRTDLRVGRGEALALMGPSGSGKTTLLKLAAGLLRPTTGGVTLHLPDAAPAEEHLRAGRVGYIPQHLGLVRNRLVLDNVLAGALARAPRLRSLVGDFPEADVAAALEALRAVGLASKWDRRAQQLSGGERQRVAIARALVQRPMMLCADEFVSNLDVANADVVLGLVDALRERGVTVLMALHDPVLAKAHADRVAVVRAGRVATLMPAGDVNVEEGRWVLQG